MIHHVNSFMSHLQELSAAEVKKTKKERASKTPKTHTNPQAIFCLADNFAYYDFRYMEQVFGLSEMFDAYIILENGDTLVHHQDATPFPKQVQDVAVSASHKGNTLEITANSDFMFSAEFLEVTDASGKTTHFLFNNKPQLFYPNGIAPNPNTADGIYALDQIIQQAKKVLSDNGADSNTDILIYTAFKVMN